MTWWALYTSPWHREDDALGGAVVNVVTATPTTTATAATAEPPVLVSVDGRAWPDVARHVRCYRLNQQTRVQSA